MIPVAYNLRNLAVRKTTTAAAAGGLALVVFVFASVMMLSNGMFPNWLDWPIRQRIRHASRYAIC